MLCWSLVVGVWSKRVGCGLSESHGPRDSTTHNIQHASVLLPSLSEIEPSMAMSVILIIIKHVILLLACLIIIQIMSKPAQSSGEEGVTAGAAVGAQLLPFLIGGGSGIVATTMYAHCSKWNETPSDLFTNVAFRFACSLQPIVRVCLWQLHRPARAHHRKLTFCSGHCQSTTTAPRSRLNLSKSCDTSTSCTYDCCGRRRSQPL